MQIAMSSTRQQFPLSPKKIIKKTTANFIGWFIALTLLWVTLWVLVLGTSGFIEVLGTEKLSVAMIGILSISIFLILNSVWTYFYQSWYFAVYFYDLTPDFIRIRKGPITPHEITMPYERIQDIYIDQDILDRMFGLYDVHLSTATISSGMEAHIDGVEKQAAEGLREILLQTVQQRISRNRNLNVSSNNPAA